MRLFAPFFFTVVCCFSGAAGAITPAPTDYRFKAETLAEGVPQPMQLEIAPDGRIFFIEIAGKVRIYKPADRQIVEAGALEVTTAQENGLLGMALDPDFARNHFIYLLHSAKQFSGQTLSRFEAKGDQLDLATRKDLLSYEEQRQECCHHAGSIRFGPDRLLYIGSGDNTNPFADSDGYAPIDERPGRGPWDAQKSAANPNDLRGKILRIKPTAEGKYGIPPGNLFPPGTPGTRPEIYVMGCRNPWRFNFDSKTGILYYGDVGPDAGGDNPRRGPRGFDTINQVRAAGNWGWPYVRGNEAYIEFDYTTKQAGAPYDPRKPVNNSPNNTGRKELPSVQPPLIWYPGSDSREFPVLGRGGRTACAGPVFHFRPEFRETGGLPAEFENCLLIYDWSRPFLKWARLDKDSKLVGIENFSSVVQLVAENANPANEMKSATIIRRPADAIFGKDGCLYLFDYGTTWGANKDSKLVRISYQWGNLAPIAKARGKNPPGREPLTVELSSEGSIDPDGDAIHFEWRLGDKLISTEAAPKFILNQPGNYRIDLRVIDAKGASSLASVPVLVGNSPPDVRFISPHEGDFFTAGRPLKYQVAVRDAEDGDSAAKGDEFAPRTLVAVTWSKGDGTSGDIDPGLTLMKQSDCFNCHTPEQKLVGPPLVEIAQKYRGQAGALDASVGRVIKGSTGVWGQLPMLPHVQHTADEVHTMVNWIFSLQSGKGAPSMVRGLNGEIIAPNDDSIRTSTLEATYTDAGRPPASALTSSVAVKLRSRRLEAEQNDEQTGPQTLGGSKASGKKFLGAIADGHAVRFASLNLMDSASVTWRVASAGEGGRIELHSGSKTGELLTAVEVKPTGDWENWIELTAPLKAAPARTDVVILFTNPGKSGLMNLDWLQFNAR